MPDASILETERLVLRLGRVEDAAVHRRMWTERDPRVPAHRRIDHEGRPTEQDIAAYVRAAVEAGGPQLLTVQRRTEGDVIGYCGLNARGHGSAEEAELAYELLRAVHGQGYATEAGLAVVAWAGGLGYRRLWAGVRDWNVASRRVLAKLGFRESGEVEVDAVHGNSILTVRDL